MLYHVENFNDNDIEEALQHLPRAIANLEEHLYKTEEVVRKGMVEL